VTAIRLERFAGWAKKEVDEPRPERRVTLSQS